MDGDVKWTKEPPSALGWYWVRHKRCVQAAEQMWVGGWWLPRLTRCTPSSSLVKRGYEFWPIPIQPPPEDPKP